MTEIRHCGVSVELLFSVFEMNAQTQQHLCVLCNDRAAVPCVEVLIHFGKDNVNQL